MKTNKNHAIRIRRHDSLKSSMGSPDEVADMGYLMAL